MRATLAARNPVVVGIAGGSGAGKSTLVWQLVAELGPDRALVLAHDSYYRDPPDWNREARRARNYDQPAALDTELLIEQLDQLAAGRAVEVPVYDFLAHARCAVTRRAEPRPVILLDGILCLTEPELRKRIDLAVFVDADEATRFERRLQRDVRERGRSPDSVARQFRDTVQPMHQKYVEPSRRFADLVIAGDCEDGAPAALAEIRSLLRRREIV